MPSLKVECEKGQRSEAQVHEFLRGELESMAEVIRRRNKMPTDELYRTGPMFARSPAASISGTTFKAILPYKFTNPPARKPHAR